MSPTTFDRLWTDLRDLRCNRSYIIELANGRPIVVDDVQSVAFRNGSAAFLDAEGRPDLFDHKSVSKIIATSANRPT